jgi:hypothetical protein
MHRDRSHSRWLGLETLLLIRLVSPWTQIWTQTARDRFGPAVLTGRERSNKGLKRLAIGPDDTRRDGNVRFSRPVP